MDEGRLVAALRAGPPDEPLYLPRRARPVARRLEGSRKTRRAPVRRSAGIALAATLGIIVLGGLIAAGSSLFRGQVPPPANTSAPTTALPGAPGSLQRVLAAGRIRIGIVSVNPGLEGRQQFDRQVAQEIAIRLGVTLDPVQTTTERIEPGGWTDQFDVAVASTILSNSAERSLRLTDPYYFDPARVWIYDTSVTTIAGLAGHSVCVAYKSLGSEWVRGALDITSATPISAPPANTKIREAASEFDCTSTHTRYSDAAVSDIPHPEPGPGVRRIDPPVFTEQLTFALDGSTADSAMLVRLNSVIEGMRADGTIGRLSQLWLGADMSQPPR
jgi:polar amino acid transport system substrate-binding protein